MDTTGDIRKWIDGKEEENNQFLTGTRMRIIEDVMTEERDNDDNTRGEAVAVHTITHAAAIDSSILRLLCRLMKTEYLQVIFRCLNDTKKKF